jgi:membrane protein implicated in regulation of membrane protease activity
MAGWVVWLLVASRSRSPKFSRSASSSVPWRWPRRWPPSPGLGLGFEAQLAVFVVASLASLLLVRPVARRHLRTPSRLRTGAAALVGEAAVVLARIDLGGGSVRLRGEVWSARAFDAERVLEPGTEVQVVEIDGATAVVAD